MQNGVKSGKCSTQINRTTRISQKTMQRFTFGIRFAALRIQHLIMNACPDAIVFCQRNLQAHCAAKGEGAMIRTGDLYDRRRYTPALPMHHNRSPILPARQHVPPPSNGNSWNGALPPCGLFHSIVLCVNKNKSMFITIIERNIAMLITPAGQGALRSFRE